MASTDIDINKVALKPTMVLSDGLLFSRAGVGPYQASLQAALDILQPFLQAAFDARYAAKGAVGSLTLGGATTSANIITTSTTTTVTNVTTVGANASSPDAVTAPRTGVRTFNIRNLADLDAFPMGSLQPGDVVNIFYNVVPYNRIIRIASKGTAALPIVFWGVTDASGKRPIISGDGARTTPGSMPGTTDNIWNATSTASWAYREGTSLIGTANRATDAWNAYRPEYVQFFNLDITGAKKGNSYYDSFGVVHAWDQACGFRVQEGAYIIVDNCVIHDNDFGYFTQAYNDTPNYAPYKCTLRNSRVYDNGMVGRSTEHSVYAQGIQPIIENNFFGPNKIGSLGSTIKIRAAGFVVRHNWMMSSDGRMLDLVHTEGSDNGVKVHATYGYGHVYGNVMTNIWSSSVIGAAYPIHIGGDNCGEDQPATQWVGGVQIPTATLTDTDLTTASTGQIAKYIHTVFFYDNTVIMKSDSGQKWRASVFDLSLSGTATNPRTNVWEWNNVFRLIGTTRWAKVRNAGKVNHMGGSIWDVDVALFDAYEDASTSRYSFSGTPRLVGAGLTDTTWLPTAQTNAMSRLPVPPSGLPTAFDSTLVANVQMAGPTNSYYVRNPISIGALDIVSGGTTTTPVTTTLTNTVLEAATAVTADTLVKDETLFTLLSGVKKAVAAFTVPYANGCSSLTFETLTAVTTSAGVQQTLQQRVDVVVMVIGGVVTAKAQVQGGLSACVSGTLTMIADAIVYGTTVNLCLTPTTTLTGVTVTGYVALSTCLGTAVSGLALLS
jgi:hypothetical protein